MKDDKLMDVAAQLKRSVRPERDLWPDIAVAIDEVQPARRRWTPMLAQAAAVLLLVGTSSGVTYMAMKDDAQGPQGPVIATPDMVFTQTSFGTRYNLGPGFQDARSSLAAALEAEMQKVSPEAKADIATNLRLIQSAIQATSDALDNDPESILLQERLLRTYREELDLLRRVSGLTRNVMMRNDI